jgi:hypothetical protein
MLQLRPLSLVAALALVGCQARPPESGPVTIRIFNRDPATGRYGQFDATFPTLADAHTLRGALGAVKTGTTWLRGGSSIQVVGGEPPLCAYHVRDGVWIPEDLETASMASTYWGLDQARSYFLRLGVGEAELTPMDIDYHPRVEFVFPNVPTFWMYTDNAGYAPTLDAFQIIPHVYFKPEVPFFLNQGVLTHEYGHRVFALLAENGARAGVPSSWSDSSKLQYASLNEGLSDFFAGMMTGNPSFISDSVPMEARDMSVARVMEAADVRELFAAGEDVDSHVMGVFVASALWQLAENVGDRERVARAVIAAERSMGARRAADPSQPFSLAEWFDLLIPHFSAEDQAAFCPLVKERFARLFELADHPLTACP